MLSDVDLSTLYISGLHFTVVVLVAISALPAYLAPYVPALIRPFLLPLALLLTIVPVVVVLARALFGKNQPGAWCFVSEFSFLALGR